MDNLPGDMKLSKTTLRLLSTAKPIIEVFLAPLYNTLIDPSTY